MTMRIETKSLLILLATLALGILLGALASGALAQRRISRIEQLRDRGGFAMHLERIIEPADATQAQAIRTILRTTAEQNRAAMSSTREQIRTNMEEMRQQLAPLLSEDQQRRLEEAVQRFRRGRPHRRPGAGPGPPDPGHRRPGPEGRPAEPSGSI
jgi:hypothetical protein